MCLRLMLLPMLGPVWWIVVVHSCVGLRRDSVADLLLLLWPDEIIYKRIAFMFVLSSIQTILMALPSAHMHVESCDIVENNQHIYISQSHWFKFSFSSCSLSLFLIHCHVLGTRCFFSGNIALCWFHSITNKFQFTDGGDSYTARGCWMCNSLVVYSLSKRIGSGA